uniref:SUI1 domain-containing protein n=1 Tax=Mus spicilegus TaxID=10103 RepID=A0A8C6HWU0_MUSSI
QGTEDYIHIRIQQRDGRQTLIAVQGVADSYDKKKLVKAFRKKPACNGRVIDHPKYREVTQLQGDQRKSVCQFLLEASITKTVHGFHDEPKHMLQFYRFCSIQLVKKSSCVYL